MQKVLYSAGVLTCCLFRSFPLRKMEIPEMRSESMSECNLLNTGKEEITSCEGYFGTVCRAFARLACLGKARENQVTKQAF